MALASSHPVSRLRPGRVAGRLVTFAILAVIAVIWAIPYIWTVRTAFSEGVNIFSATLELVPRSLTFDNVVQVFRLAPVARMTVNSAIIVLGSTALIIVSSALAGYALSQPGLPLARVIMVFFLAAIMVPGEALLIPTFLAVRDLGLLNSYPGVILPMASDAFVIFVFERFFSQLPSEVLDAAIVDGASELQVFWRVVLPMSTPAIAAMTTLVFIGAYDAFLWPLVILNGPDMMPLTLGLYYFATEQLTHYEYIITYSLLLTLPVLLIFLVGQKFFIRGLQLGAVKG